MNKPKFTKGEWVVFYPLRMISGGHISVENEDGRHIYTVEVFNSTLTESAANAHLIAAAPEMYRLLEKLSLSLNIEDFQIDKINQVLAKARGEQ